MHRIILGRAHVKEHARSGGTGLFVTALRTHRETWTVPAAEHQLKVSAAIDAQLIDLRCDCHGYFSPGWFSVSAALFDAMHAIRSFHDFAKDSVPSR